ncbi:hypothetical protein F5B20DRAFT_6335 [Whalleya microplaca]|nr:hypothetical protein F5B20DRAFT_6335 [Whalleya microplaca]
MPVMRELSPRSRNWPLWNSSKTSLVANKPSEIIHLGGSRVDSTSELEPSVSENSEIERSITPWSFRPPTPKSPGSVVAKGDIDNAVGRLPDVSPKPPPERPTTLWTISDWHPPAESGADASDANNEVFDFPALSPTPLRIPSGKRPNPTVTVKPISLSALAHENPPLPSITSSIYSGASASRLRSPVYSPLPSASSTHSNLLNSRSRSPLPSPYSLFPPTDSAFKGLPKGSHSTTSVAPIAREQWKPLPARPARSEDEGLRERAKGKPREIGTGQQHIVQFMKLDSPARPTGPARPAPTTRPRNLPPLTSSSPDGPLPAISQDNLRKHSKEKERPAHKSRRAASESNIPTESLGLTAPKLARTRTLTPQQRLWLHRNYRGEATFLKAWGLSINREGDRDEGLEILRELMTAEAERKLPKPQQWPEDERYHQHARTQSETSIAPSLRDREALQVIMEERNSREVRLRSTKEGLGYIMGENQGSWTNSQPMNN